MATNITMVTIDNNLSMIEKGLYYSYHCGKCNNFLHSKIDPNSTIKERVVTIQNFWDGVCTCDDK